MYQDPLLLTPGPLTTAPETRAAMTRDYGSRDSRFVALSDAVRAGVLALAGGDETWACVPLQGSGTFAVEAAIGTFVPRAGKLLVLVNGAYGRRMKSIAAVMGRDVNTLVFDETVPVDPEVVDQTLRDDPAVTHVALVHCETTTGVLNPVQDIGDVIARHGRRLLLDSMSAFGALPVDVKTLPVDALMASSNKCLEGVPGMGFVVAPIDALRAAEGNAHSLSLDLQQQQVAFARNGQWRFTPPTQVVAALAEALRLHAAEGGVEGRGARYRVNCDHLIAGMKTRGFETLLRPGIQAPIIVTFHQPETDWFDFEGFYAALRTHGFAIYPGKLTQAPTFRVGCIGQVTVDDIDRFLTAVDLVCEELGR